VRNGYDLPATLGADRWCALIAARPSAPCIIVDAGSAVTIDALSGDGTFMGGVILPGLDMMRAVLDERTGLIRDTAGCDDDVLARTTASGVASGTLIGLAGAVDAIVAAQRDMLGAPAPALLCGGDGAKLLALLRSTPVTLTPDLVLRGLAVIAGCSAPAQIE
jgi:type III pantothenate kinase